MNPSRIGQASRYAPDSCSRHDRVKGYGRTVEGWPEEYDLSLSQPHVDPPNVPSIRPLPRNRIGSILESGMAESMPLKPIDHRRHRMEAESSFVSMYAHVRIIVFLSRVPVGSVLYSAFKGARQSKTKAKQLS